MASLATIVNFCTNESRYLRACLEQALLFSQQVIVPVCDHFFDGTPENRKLLEAVYAAFPSCLFVEYPFIPNEIPKEIFQEVEPAHFWHNLSRLVAVNFLEKGIERVLFLDADEVVEGERFSRWLQAGKYQKCAALKLATYWYFRQPEYQALQWEDSPVLVQTKKLSQKQLLATEERQAIYQLSQGLKERMVVDAEDVPMVHHYSWVRTQEEMLKKVRSWGHKGDRDWESLVHEEFSRPFSGTDFVHGYCFREVACPFGITLESPLFAPQGAPHVRRLQLKQLLELLPKRRKSLIFRGLFDKMRCI